MRFDAVKDYFRGLSGLLSPKPNVNRDRVLEERDAPKRGDSLPLNEENQNSDSTGHVFTTHHERQPPVGSYITASSVYEVLRLLERGKKYFNECDALLTCPAISLAVKSLFPNSEVVTLQDTDAMRKLSQISPVNSVGVVSPWLLGLILKSVYGPFTLHKMTRQDLYFLPDFTTIAEEERTRKILHRVGFYEVSELLGSEELDSTSIGVLANGDFRYFGSQIGLSNSVSGDAVNPYRASRLPRYEQKDAHWANCLPVSFRSTPGGFAAPPNELALAVTSQRQSENPRNLKIAGKFTWSMESKGHASLVACYGGPGDTNMYACLLSVDVGPSVSLWKEDGGWTMLGSKKLSHLVDQANGGTLTIELQFHVTESELGVSVASRDVLTLTNTDLVRTEIVGVRVFGSDISVTWNVNNQAND